MTILVVVSLVPYFWWYGIQYNFANIMQEDWGVSPIMTAVRLWVAIVGLLWQDPASSLFTSIHSISNCSLPISIGGGIMFIAIGYLPPSFVPLKIRMIVGALIAAVGTLLFVFADGTSWYWKLVAPGMFIGSFGESS